MQCCILQREKGKLQNEQWKCNSQSWGFKQCNVTDMDNLDNIHILELKEAFDEFDKVLCERITINDFESWLCKDGSGAISSGELLLVMRALGKNPTEDEVLTLLMKADVDGNGTIDFEEFVKMMKNEVASLATENSAIDFTWE